MSHTSIPIPDRLLISGPNDGGLAILHGQRCLHLLTESATGIGIDGEQVAWCPQRDGVARSIVGIRDGRIDEHELGDNDLDLHDLLPTPQGWHVVSTADNAVLRLDADWRIQHRREFPGERDSMHLNSLCWHGGRLLASAFGRFDTHRGYKGRTEKAGIVIDVETGDTIVSGLSQPHSLQSVDGELWLCDSERNQLVVAAGKPHERRINLPGYTRGLSIGAEHVYVGLSRSRNPGSDANIDRFDAAAVAVLRRSDLEVLGYVPLPWNEIYDIRLLPSDVAMASLAALGLDRLRAQLLRQGNESDERERESARLLSQARHLEAHAIAALSTTQQGLIESQKTVMETNQHAQQLVAETDQIVAEANQRTEAASRESQTLAAQLIDANTALHAVDTTLEQVLGSRSWRVTRPLRVLTRLLRHGGMTELDREALSGAVRRASMRMPMMAKTVARLPQAAPSGPKRDDANLLGQDELQHMGIDAAPRLPSKPDIYMWSVIDWHFRNQRPQHLARALAQAGHRVFYISVNFIDRQDAGFAIEPLDKYGRLYQVHLQLAGKPSVYRAPPTPEQNAQLEASLACVVAWHGGDDSVSIVQHPYWADLATKPPLPRVLYDCMDHHAGFADNLPAVLEREQHLLRTADLTIVTSQWLREQIASHGGEVVVIRNAADHLHFRERPAKVFADPQGRRVIGYYGAIAQWFDTGLIRTIAEAFPQCLVVLVGDDTAGAGTQLADLDNVRLIGEVKYDQLPYWLHAFDACLLPFKVEELTLATNPVKVYEYLSAGKPVVAVDLPEMAQFGDLVRRAATHHGFVEAVAAALAEPETAEVRQQRREFAAEQNWDKRAQELDETLAQLRLPRASVIVVTYNNLALTRACLDSLQRFSEWPELEIIVVDNASADDTPDFLREWAQAGPDRHIILNADNRGFAAANNQGLAAATGDYLILLNNDTVVTRGWVRGLVDHLRADPQLGMVGPVTNNIGNEARIETSYTDMAQMHEFAVDYTRRHARSRFGIPTLAFFCVAMPRSTYERVGTLDEAFGIGFFEDDDYCRRVEQAGLQCACAEDVFVHHQLSASFDQLKADRRQALFKRNKAIYEAKWGAWVAHAYRRSDDPN